MHRFAYIIDAFTGKPYAGNAAAVVLDADGLDEAAMQAIAAEFNLSETTFVLTPEAKKDDGGHHVHIRWFTPTCEAKMCGHATIAGMHALVESGRVPCDAEVPSVEFRIDTCSGRLTGFVERSLTDGVGRMYWLELRPPKLEPCRIDPTEFAGALGVGPEAIEMDWPSCRTQDADLLLPVRRHADLVGARPDFSRLDTLLRERGLRGLSLFTMRTLSPTITVQSRFFAPPVGINEDPVTGSVHGPLCAYLAEHGLSPEHDGRWGMMCVQGRPGGRTGIVFGLVQRTLDGFSVRIGGQAATVLQGRLVGATS